MSVGGNGGKLASKVERNGRANLDRPPSVPDRPRRRLRPQSGQSLFTPRSSFVGRDDAKEEVAWRLQTSGLLTLTGPGGVGKTRLALEVAAHLSQRGQEVAFVDLDLVSDQSSVLPALAAAVGLGAEPSPSLLDALVAHLGQNSLVLVLDTCDHLRPWCAQVTERLLCACAGLRILATSRQRLGVAGEVVWLVPPLSLPEAGAAALSEAWLASEAVRLFCERAAALQQGFLPTPDNVGAIVEICRRLDANPLAIELAAARVVALAPEEIAARLDDRFGLLGGGLSTAPARHRSLRANLEWSDELLTPPERALLRRLSVFPAFTLRAAEEVCGGDDIEAAQVLESLTALVEKSLVVAEPTGRAGRFRLTETVRAYAAERLAERGCAAALAERHAVWCVAQLEGAEPTRDWVERLEAEQDSLRAALEWSLAHERADLALRLVRGHMRLWERRGRFAEAREALERVLGATEGGPEPLRAPVLHDAGFAALMVGDLDAASRHLRASIALSADGRDIRTAARARSLLGFVSTFGDDPASLEALEHAAAEVAATGDDACLAEVLAACGQARMFRGESAVARRHFDESLQAARGAGYHSLLATGLIGLGSAELVQGDYPAAEGHLQESTVVAAASGDTHSEVVAGTWLGELALRRGDHGDAQRRFQECLNAARAMAAPYPLVRSLFGVGRATLEAGEPQMAQALFGEAAVVAQRAGLAHLLAAALVGRAHAALALGDAVRARSDLDEALSLARRRADRAGEALALEGWADLSRSEGDLREARSRYREALALRAQVGDAAALARCLEALGRLAVVDEDFSVAARLLGAAESVRARLGCARPASQAKEHAAAVESAHQALGESFHAQWRQGERLTSERAVAYAGKWRGRRVTRPAMGWEALTGAERKVAELAAQGRTNAQIARELAIAPATVKAHLRRVFAKLGLQTRAAVAAELHRLAER